MSSKFDIFRDRTQVSKQKKKKKKKKKKWKKKAPKTQKR